MRKKYVLDTSALITDLEAYNNFPDSDVIIPIVVLTELDNLKKQPGEAGKNARVCIKLLDELCSDQDITKGISLKNNSKLEFSSSYFQFMKDQMSDLGDPSYGDTQILACAIEHSLKNPESKVTLVSNDINLRVKAKAKGLLAQKHEKEGTSYNDLYQGFQTICNPDLGIKLRQENIIDPSEYGLNLYPNECVILQDDDGNTVALGRKIADNKLKLVKNHAPWGLVARNAIQSLSLDLMLQKNIDLITLTGPAGTGKTLCALAASLELVLQRKQYEKLIIFRPVTPLANNDIGFLPGTIEEKMAPWFEAILDSMEVLFSSEREGKNKDLWKKDLEMFQRKGKLFFEPLAHIRGRSLPNSIILVDEAQNISPQEMATIVTRVGEGSLLILCGDRDQIDSKNLDSINNGLVYVIDKFKEYEFAGHLTFKDGVRSRLATFASKVL